MKGTIQKHDNGTTTLTNVDGANGKNYCMDNIDVYDVERITEEEMIHFFKTHPFTDQEIINMVKPILRTFPNIAIVRNENKKLKYLDLVKFKISEK